MIHLPDLSCFYDSQCAGVDTKNSLPEFEAHHALKVLRLKVGDDFLVSNGVGTIFLCKVLDVNRRDLVYSAIEKKIESNEKPFKTTVACGVLGSQSRMEWMVEKLTEIGVNEILFYHNTRSKKKTLNISRLNKTVVSALKQSRKAFLPEINEWAFNDLIQLNYKLKLAAICDENEYNHVSTFNDQESLMLIGPEGDFSSQEIELLLENDFKPCTLGNERLRSETAAIYALTCLNANMLKE